MRTRRHLHCLNFKGTVLTVRTEEPDPRAPPTVATSNLAALARPVATRDLATMNVILINEPEEGAPTRDGFAYTTRTRRLRAAGTPMRTRIAQPLEAVQTI